MFSSVLGPKPFTPWIVPARTASPRLSRSFTPSSRKRVCALRGPRPAIVMTSIRPVGIWPSSSCLIGRSPVSRMVSILSARSLPMPGRSSSFSSGLAATTATGVERSFTTRAALRYARTRKKFAPLISRRSATSSKMAAICELSAGNFSLPRRAGPSGSAGAYAQAQLTLLAVLLPPGAAGSFELVRGSFQDAREAGHLVAALLYLGDDAGQDLVRVMPAPVAEDDRTVAEPAHDRVDLRVDGRVGRGVPGVEGPVDDPVALAAGPVERGFVVVAARESDVRKDLVRHVGHGALAVPQLADHEVLALAAHDVVGPGVAAYLAARVRDRLHELRLRAGDASPPDEERGELYLPFLEELEDPRIRVPAVVDGERDALEVLVAAPDDLGSDRGEDALEAALFEGDHAVVHRDAAAGDPVCGIDHLTNAFERVEGHGTDPGRAAANEGCDDRQGEASDRGRRGKPAPEPPPVRVLHALNSTRRASQFNLTLRACTGWTEKWTVPDPSPGCATFYLKETGICICCKSRRGFHRKRRPP